MHMVNLHLSHQVFLPKAHCMASRRRASVHVQSRVMPDCSSAVTLETAMLRPASVLNTKKLMTYQTCNCLAALTLLYVLDRSPPFCKQLWEQVQA
jgi:hypothetical protein